MFQFSAIPRSPVYLRQAAIKSSAGMWKEVRIRQIDSLTEAELGNMAALAGRNNLLHYYHAGNFFGISLPRNSGFFLKKSGLPLFSTKPEVCLYGHGQLGVRLGVGES
jgi:hypothetical protein